MTDETPIDRAHALMAARPEDDAARLAFYERLGDAELFLLLEEEARDETLKPRIFDLGHARMVLAFDREERLAAFVGRSAPYAALSGRVIAALLAEQGLGLGLNFEVAPSSFLLPAEGLAWLAETLRHAPRQVEAGIAELTPPKGLPERVLLALDTKLATAAGLAKSAYLAGATYRDGSVGHILGVIDAVAGAEEPLAKAIGEALTFSGVEAGALDVAFFSAADVTAARLAKVGLRFDLPVPSAGERDMRIAPGTDPAKPPILR